MSTCTFTTTFLLLIAAYTTTVFITAATTPSTREHEALRSAKSMVSQAKVWVDHKFVSLDHNNDEEISNNNNNNNNVMRQSLALSDCSKLYGNSESRLTRLLDGEDYTVEDAQTWLSGVLANHRTCLDGLGEEGHASLDGLSRGLMVNLTRSLRHTLAFYGRERVVRRGNLFAFLVLVIRSEF